MNGNWIKLFYLTLLFLTIHIVHAVGQTGCTTSAAGIASEFDDQTPSGTSVYEFSVSTETPAGMADINKFQVEWPELPMGGYSDFVNPLGSSQSDSIFCVTTTGASNEGPDVVLNVIIPPEATVTCSDVSFRICRVGDFNGDNEVVWIVNKELMDIAPSNADHTLGCIAGTGGSECQGYGAVGCETVTISAAQIAPYIMDGVFTIALITAGGDPSSNSGDHTDDNCADPSETGNCFRLVDFSFDIVETPNNFNLTVPDLCIGTPQMASVTVDGTLPISYNWSVVSGDVTLGANGNSTISVTGNTAGPYELSVTATNGSGPCNGTVSSSATIYGNPSLSSPSNVGPICSGSTTSFTSNVSMGVAPYDFQWQFSSDGVNFFNLIEGIDFTGTTTETLNVNNISIAQDGWLFRLLVTDANNCGGVPHASTSASLSVLPCQPELDLTKSLINVSAAASNIAGNVDAEYSFTVCNTGPVDINNINLMDDFGLQFGAAFVGVVIAPSIQASTTAAVPPTVNASFSGISPNQNMLQGDGALDFGTPGECVTVNVTVEIDLDKLEMNTENQAVANGTTDMGIIAEDDSDNDSPTDPDNPLSDDDDPTPFPSIADINAIKEVFSLEVLPSGKVQVVFDITIDNSGNTNLSSLSVLDDLSNLGSAYTGGSAEVVVTNINAKITLLIMMVCMMELLI